MKLPELYQEYRSQNEKFQKRRRDIMKQPEMDVHEAAVDLNVYELKRRVETKVAAQLNKAWKLYDEIWSGEPDKKTMRKFLEVAKPLMDYKEFLLATQLDVLKVSCNLIEAYEQSFHGTIDEYNQKSVIDE